MSALEQAGALALLAHLEAEGKRPQVRFRLTADVDVESGLDADFAALGRLLAAGALQDLQGWLERQAELLAVLRACEGARQGDGWQELELALGAGEELLGVLRGLV